MKSPAAPDEVWKPAADAVVELALQSLRPHALRWDTSFNMAMTQLAWNAGCEGEPPLALGVFSGDRALRRLLEELLAERQRRWPHLTCMVFDLDVRHVAGEIVFTFTLSRDGGEHGRPFEITVDGLLAHEP